MTFFASVMPYSFTLASGLELEDELDELLELELEELELLLEELEEEELEEELLELELELLEELPELPDASQESGQLTLELEAAVARLRAEESGQTVQEDGAAHPAQKETE